MRRSVVKATPQNIAPEVRDGFNRANQRFFFNIAQIEKKYSNLTTSGIVFGCNDESVEFDETVQDAEDDDLLINAVRRELNHVDSDYGGSLLCAPAPDPDESDEKNLTRWMKLNKVYDIHYTRQKAKENAPPKFKQPALPSTKKRKAIEDSAPDRKRQLVNISDNTRSSILDGPLERSPDHRMALDSRKAALVQPNLYQRMGIMGNMGHDQRSLKSAAIVSESIKSGAIASRQEEEPEFLNETRISVFKLPSCSTPKAITYHNVNSPMTRLRRKCLEIDHNYDLNQSIYADVDEGEFIRRWLKDVKQKMKAGDLDKRIFPRWQRIETADHIDQVKPVNQRRKTK
ncbi:unnamed protein product [Bursaphelenchus okinawaensis]|uniref:Uncharacterized protein n=1 Tax=Bursaphelenchus okinawaensis TaxID=465554 RepID=A0A811L116_9BILA|nr:unnamed protein product [Bursaphelenchus okinawaensis]CAG9114810.1 unnamed protein product [Bursaphelenchus okinawaensis]